MDRENLANNILRNVVPEHSDTVFEADCKNIAFLLDNCEIYVPQNNRFFIQTNAGGLQGDLYYKRANYLTEKIETPQIKDGISTRAYTGNFDFSHTCPYWEDILELGIFGLRERLFNYFQRNDSTHKQIIFYQSCLLVYDAAIRFLQRASIVARQHNKIEMAENLEFLSNAKPQTLYQRLQTIFIFYMLQHSIEVTYVRTLGRLDSLLYPYFIKENRAFALKLIEDFIKEIDTLQAPSNIPFAIGGTDQDGNSLINSLSYIILDTYGKLNTNNTKFHILCNKNTPEDILERAFELIRAGKNSIVFMSDKTAIEGLENLGASHFDACRYHIVGCYECGAEGELTSSCNARINIPKALETTINQGRDIYTNILLLKQQNEEISDFESLFQAFLNTMLIFTDRAMQATNAWERVYYLLHASPFLSSTYPSALEKGGDLYCNYTAKYNNSSINAIGLATAVDSLVAIRKLVFEDKKFTLKQFTEILKNNWNGHEILRLQIKNNYPKFGTGNIAVDELAKRIIEKLSEHINKKPNAKGGIWRLGTFSIDWRWDFGAHTYASADGRKAGETLSQNTSATFGADKQGATGHLLSVSSFPHTLTPNGSIADIDLHSSAVRGENGINALIATLRTYFERKGLAVHYNVLDTETLKKAKKDPSSYPNLQVRLCGWNVLFSSLSEKEKDEFIARSEREETI